MGLDMTHDCWHGAYSAFLRWRRIIARLTLGIELLEMEGFKRLGHAVLGRHDTVRSWHVYGDRAIVKLLNHSDCDGEIIAKDCGPIADELEAVMPQLRRMPNEWGHLVDLAVKTQAFIDGLRSAASRGEDVYFR